MSDSRKQEPSREVYSLGFLCIFMLNVTFFCFIILIAAGEPSMETFGGVDTRLRQLNYRMLAGIVFLASLATSISLAFGRQLQLILEELRKR